MGMTRRREGAGSLRIEAEHVVALAGNPNVGKSTVFNALTGLERHTGNWTGKTVDLAAGFLKNTGKRYAVVDLPGCWTLDALSPEEEIARGFIESGEADCTVVVCDASCPERSIKMALSVLALSRRAVICLNLSDEARRRGVVIDAVKLGEMFGARVVRTSASSGEGLGELVSAIGEVCEGNVSDGPDRLPSADEAVKAAVTRDKDSVSARRLRLDRFLTGRFTGVLSMLAMLSAVFLVTMVGANYPSMALEKLFGLILPLIKRLAVLLRLPKILGGMLTDGGFSTLFTVISVMLPPMAIFFPLFTFAEDLGLLPRIAFNLDRPFKCCGGCGKMALTSCMGFGCNAAGVVGCRIIEGRRERLMAVLTNSLVPCNGRFPALFALTALIVPAGFAGGALGALLITAFVIVSLLAVLLVTKLLDLTLPGRGKPVFVLELPPYRRPKVGKLILRSLLDRTIFVLGRAAAAAFPAGCVIWLLTECGALPAVAGFLDPLGRLMGVDGEVLTAFVLGLPANELVMPLMLLLKGAELESAGVTAFTAFQIMLLMLFHSPCLTTLLSIRRETRSFRAMLAAFAIPSALGVTVCMLTNGLRLLFT